MTAKVREDLSPPRVQIALCSSWAPPHVLNNPSRLLALAQWCNQESTSTSNGTTSDGRDLGYSFPGNGPTECLPLQDVAARYHAKVSGGLPERIPVVSLGAGCGVFEWKLIAAGAKLDIVEQDKSLAQRCLAHARERATSFLLPGETIASTYHIYVTDVMGKHVGTLRNCYDVACAAHLLHMLHPSQVAPFFARLFAMLVTGGTAYVSCDAPCGDERHASDTIVKVEPADATAYDVYETRRARGEAFPGYMAMMQQCEELRSTHPDHTFDAYEGPVVHRYSELYATEQDVMPHALVAQTEAHIVRSNVAASTYPSATLRMLPQTRMVSAKEVDVLCSGHVWATEVTRVLHYFTIPQLRTLATTAGFEVVEAYYTDSRNERYPTETPSPEVFRTKFLSCFVKLRKSTCLDVALEEDEQPGAALPCPLPQVAARTVPSASVSLASKVPFAPATQKSTPQAKAMFRRDESHVCTAGRCRPDRPMCMVIEAIRSMVPRDRDNAQQLLSALRGLQLRLIACGDSFTPAYQALIPQLGIVLNQHISDGDPLQQVVGDIVRGTTDYVTLLPTRGFVDFVPGGADARADEAEQESFRRMTLDQLALRLHSVPLQLLRQRLAETARERCRYYNGTWIMF
jgi:hypothetical protein